LCFIGLGENDIMKADQAQTRAAGGVGPPFDPDLLDRLMEQAGIDVIIATSKHNIQYLLGGYRFFFFDFTDALGTSRYLPVFIYFKGRPERSSYIGNPMEAYERELGRFWVENVQSRTWGTFDAIQAATEILASQSNGPRRIGVEMSFLPADAHLALAAAFPEAEIVDCLFPLERLRARKSPSELEILRQASERVVDSMLAAMASHGPGTTKRQLSEGLRLEEVKRGLTFEYCLITAGANLNRAPSDQRVAEGDIVSLDSGGNYRGYIGDLCRMAIAGEPDQELVDLLNEIEEIQQAARRPIRQGVAGGEIFLAAAPLLKRSAYCDHLSFVAHGMGIVSHEAPRLTDRGPVPYSAYDAERPLEAGMVVSIETTLQHPRRGFIKLEDTVAVTAQGWEAFGDRARGWNTLGAAMGSRPP
jgi:Xaa-Pro aminopeptidase